MGILVEDDRKREQIARRERRDVRDRLGTVDGNANDDEALVPPVVDQALKVSELHDGGLASIRRA